MSGVFIQPEKQDLGGHYYLRWWPHISAFLLVVVELCWILPWFGMVTQITSTASLETTALILGGIMLMAYSVGYLMEALRLLKNIQLAVMGVLLITGLMLAENLLLNEPIHNVTSGLVRLDPGAVLVLFFTIWMWWRGISLSRADIRPITAWRRFELGMLFFMGYIFIAARAHYVLPSLGVIVLFLFSGLMSVFVARISYVGLVKGVRKNPFDLRWLVSVCGFLGGSVLLAATLGGLLSGQYRLVLDFLGDTIKFMIAVTIFIFGIPGLMVSYLFGPILPWLRSIFARTENTPTPEYPGQFANPFMSGQENAINFPLIIQAICFWGLVILVVVLLILRIRKNLGTRREAYPTEVESLLGEGEARKLLQKSFQDALNALGSRFKTSRREIVVARIRRIYAQLMELCDELNQPRLPQQTPLEFLPEMGELFSNQLDDLRKITQAYIRIRYGELPEINEELDALEKSWQNVQEEGRRLKRSGVGKLRTAKLEKVERSGV
jgi:hypothetical protein